MNYMPIQSEKTELTPLISSSAIEDAEAEYLALRAIAVRDYKDNLYGSQYRREGALSAFLVRATKSPMLNRICGVPESAANAIDPLLNWFRENNCSAAIPLTFDKKNADATVMLGSVRLQKLRGWSHAQMCADVKKIDRIKSSIETELMLNKNIDDFIKIHSQAFGTSKDVKDVYRASFLGLMDHPRIKGYVAKIEGKVVAGAVVYFSENGVAYLGTAATERAARGKGCHSALILARIAAARDYGCQTVAATVMPSSQSCKNMKRFGFSVSHFQSLFTSIP